MKAETELEGGADTKFVLAAEAGNAERGLVLIFETACHSG
jgi:hypothetical protein